MFRDILSKQLFTNLCRSVTQRQRTEGRWKMTSFITLPSLSVKADKPEKFVETEEQPVSSIPVPSPAPLAHTATRSHRAVRSTVGC